jgi:hypothetical protein
MNILRLVMRDMAFPLFSFVPAIAAALRPVRVAYPKHRSGPAFSGY